MTKKINTYQDLQLRKAQLRELLDAQKELLRQDVIELKQELKPFSDTVAFVGRLTTKDRSNPMLNEGVDFAIDLVVKKWLMSRSGWLSRLAIPFLMKNYSSHVLSDNKEEWIGSVANWVKSTFLNKEKKKETGDVEDGDN